MNEKNKTNKGELDAAVDNSRREAMLKMAAYTAPVLLMTLTSEKAMAVSRGHHRSDDEQSQNNQGQNNDSQS